MPTRRAFLSGSLAAALVGCTPETPPPRPTLRQRFREYMRQKPARFDSTWTSFDDLGRFA